MVVRLLIDRIQGITVCLRILKPTPVFNRHPSATVVVPLLGLRIGAEVDHIPPKIPPSARKTIDLEGRIVKDGVKKALRDRHGYDEHCP